MELLLAGFVDCSFLLFFHVCLFLLLLLFCFCFCFYLVKNSLVSYGFVVCCGTRILLCTVCIVKVYGKGCVVKGVW